MKSLFLLMISIYIFFVFEMAEKKETMSLHFNTIGINTDRAWDLSVPVHCVRGLPTKNNNEVRIRFGEGLAVLGTIIPDDHWVCALRIEAIHASSATASTAAAKAATTRIPSETAKVEVAKVELTLSAKTTVADILLDKDLGGKKYNAS